MSKKYFAVKVGLNPGIHYDSWATVTKFVTGYKGSVYKGFADKTDALSYYYDNDIPQEVLEDPNYPLDQLPERAPPDTYNLPLIGKSDIKNILNIDRSALDLPPQQKQIFIYIDGSKRPSVNHRGSGCYCRFNKQDYAFSIPFSSDIANRYDIKPSDIPNLSSPSAEYLALSECLLRFIKFTVREQQVMINNILMTQIVKLNPPLQLIFVCDYNGVKHFTEGSWTPKEDYIIKIRDTCAIIINFLKEKGVDIKIHHVNGHIGIFGNELSDYFAKSQTPFDSIPQLVNHISQYYKTI